MKIREFSNYQPMNLQFFADDSTAGADDSTKPETPTDIQEDTGTDSGKESVSEKTYEDAMAEIAAAQAELKKAKADRDAALKKSGELTKQLRAKMSEAELKAEQAAQEDEERKAYVAELENYKRKNEAIKRYQLQGMGSELAEKAAQAEIDGDMDALADAFKQQKTLDIKAERAKWMGERGRVNMGDGDDSASMTKEEILAIKDAKERQIAIAKNFKLFEN